MKNLLDPAELKTAIDNVHRAGMPGVFAEVRGGDQVWRDAAGVADVSTGRPVTPDMRHRVGIITKTFTAAAILQQAESGQIGLDTPISHYLAPECAMARNLQLVQAEAVVDLLPLKEMTETVRCICASDEALTIAPASSKA